MNLGTLSMAVKMITTPQTNADLIEICEKTIKSLHLLLLPNTYALF